MIRVGVDDFCEICGFFCLDPQTRRVLLMVRRKRSVATASKSHRFIVSSDNGATSVEKPEVGVISVGGGVSSCILHGVRVANHGDLQRGGHEEESERYASDA